MATFSFRGDKYNCDSLEKLCSSGHIEVVNKNSIVVIDGIRKDKKLTAIKLDGMYHLLQGSIDPEQEDFNILCINKFVLKKCKIEAPVNSNNTGMTFQQKWNAENTRQTRSYGDSY